jgi:hypothetical protein
MFNGRLFTLVHRNTLTKMALVCFHSLLFVRGFFADEAKQEGRSCVLQ